MMYRFEEILVALDLSKTDDGLIKYALGVANVVEAKEVIFMHVASNQDLSSTVSTEDGKTTTVKEQIKSNITHTVGHFQSLAPNAKTVVEVLTGDPINIMLKASKEQKVDLIIVGRKSVGQGSGKVSRALARRALCAVLSVPFNAKLELKKVILPIDYSKFSKMAIEKAISLAKKRPDLEIICLNIYSLPQGFRSSGKTEEEFAQIMKKNAEKRYKYFLLGLGIFY